MQKIVQRSLHPSPFLLMAASHTTIVILLVFKHLDMTVHSWALSSVSLLFNFNAAIHSITWYKESQIEMEDVHVGCAYKTTDIHSFTLRQLCGAISTMPSIWLVEFHVP